MTKVFLSVICHLFIRISFGQTQLEINENADKAFRKSDKELNSIYNSIIKAYKSDTLFIRNLKIAQRIWIQFRDAEMNAKYPEREYGYYGSIHPMCWSNYLKELTENRIKTLRIWLKGIPEGESCTSSIRTND